MDILRSQHPPIPGEFYRCIVGSTLSGLSTGDGDRDEMGICIEPKNAVTGLETFTHYKWRSQPEGQPSGKGDLDLTVYGLRHWMALAVKGNPTILDLLFVPMEFRLIDQILADDIRSLRPYLLSKQSASAYLGYLTAQRERMLGIRGGRNVVRPLDDKDYDSKHAMHMVRLGFQGVQLLTEGAIELPMQGDAREFCLSVRRGQVSKDDVLTKTVELEAQLARLRRNSTLPDKPDMEHINNWLHSAYAWTWGYGVDK